MVRACGVVVAGVLALAVAGVGVRADDPPKVDPAKTEPVRLDTKSLGEMLTDMGADPKLQENRFQKVNWTAGTWTSPVWLSVSDDKKTVWVYTSFVLRPDYADAPAVAWLKLLEKNDEIGPSYFALEENATRLALRRPLRNADLTAAQLRKELTAFVGTIQKTESLWRAAAFIPAPTREAEKVLARLAGAWGVVSYTQEGTPAAAEMAAKLTFVFEKNQVRGTNDGKEALKAVVHVVVKGETIEFDFVNAAGGTDKGILKIEGDTLTLCSSSTGAERPTEFASPEKSKTVLIVLKRKS